MMRIANWDNFELIEASQGQKIENYNGYLLMRPDPLAKGKEVLETAVDAYYQDKKWNYNREIPEKIIITYKDMHFITHPTSFKHTGIFPEQASNWDFMRQAIGSYQKPVRILNLFAYTGAATIACALEDNCVEVVHVESLKSLNQWTKENVEINHLEDKTIRTLQDDVIKFLKREIRRGRTYHGVVMDPPSFGKGPKGELWEIHKRLPELLELVNQVLDPNPCFLVINTYSTKLSEKDVLKLSKAIFDLNKKAYNADTLALRTKINDKILPCGQTVRWCYDASIL